MSRCPPSLQQQPQYQQSAPVRSRYNSPLQYRSFATTTTQQQEQEEEQRRQTDDFDRVAEMARDAYKIGKDLLGMVNVEHKKIQTIYTAISSWNGGGTNNLVLLNQSSQGVTDETRTGDSIKITGVRFAGRIVSQSTGGLGHIRVLLVWQKGANTLTNVFPSAIGAVDGFLDFAVKGTTLATSASKDYDSGKLFEVIWDRTFTYDDSHGPRLHSWKDHINFSRHTIYENNSNTINNGVLTCIVVDDNAVNNAANPAILINAEVYFVDN